MQKIYKKSVLFLTLSSVLALTGCSDKEDSQPQTQVLEEGQLKDSQENISNETATKEKLTLDTNRCIGCGKCARVAPNNFKMSGRKANITSQEKTESEAVQKAIKSCPVSIIKLG